MGLISEFKEFAMKGSVVDLAVGVVIGAAFGKIVNSIVTDLMMPPLGLLIGGVDFSQQKIVLRHAVLDAAGKTTSPETAITYGVFLNNVINFLIVAIAIFIVVKLMNSAKRSPPPADPAFKECPRCCSTIAIKATRCPNCTSDLPATA
jgi:large conductance mechanosensitive channel